MAPDTLLLIWVGLFAALLLAAAVRDLTSYIIPNWISLALLAGFLPAAWLAWKTGVPALHIGQCLMVGFAVLAAGVAMFALNWLGGGDAKLLAAAALWIGWQGLAAFLFWTTLAGGVLALVLLTVRRRTAPAGEAPATWVDGLLRKGAPVPYGVAIAVGALAALPEGALTASLSLPLQF